MRRGAFILHCLFRTSPPRPGGTETCVRGFRHVGVVSVAFTRVRGRVRGPVLRDGTRPLILAVTPRSRPAPTATAVQAASALPGAKRRSSDCRLRTHGDG